jgi:hypothetical protein
MEFLAEKSVGAIQVRYQSHPLYFVILTMGTIQVLCRLVLFAQLKY